MMVGVVSQVAGEVLHLQGPVLLAGRVLLSVGETMCSQLKVSSHAHSHFCGLLLDCLEQVLSCDRLCDMKVESNVLSTHPHLLSLLAMLMNFDPTLEQVR